MSAFLSLAIAVFTCGAVTPAQDPWLHVSAPAQVFELEEGYAISVSGGRFSDATPSIRVFLGQSEITSQLTVTLTHESRVDADSDGVLEDYTGEFTVAFDQFVPSRRQLLRTEVSVNGSAGVASDEEMTEVVSHVAVNVDNAIDFGEESVHVAVTVEGLFVASQTLEIYLGSNDVTSSVTITGPVTVFEALTPGTPPFVRLRRQYYTVDVSALGEFAGALQFVASVSGTGRGGVTTGSSSAASETIGEGPFEPVQPNPCNDALDAFMEALELSGGGSSGSPTAVNASAQEVKDAAKALQDALEANNCPLRGQHTGPDGQTMKYSVGKDASSNSKKDAKASSKDHDLVVAIGGDAPSGTGGSATATNEMPGGAAVAVGGNGSSGSSSPGTGGNATSVATPPAGSTAPAAGQATSVGGYGGHNGNPNQAGGMGGSATAKVGEHGGGNYPGAPGAAGSPGTAGGGGWDVIVGGEGQLDNM